MSEARTRPSSRRDTSTRRASPAGWPNRSLMAVKLSTSMTSSIERVPRRSPTRGARSSRSASRIRLGSPVRSSWSTRRDASACWDRRRSWRLLPVLAEHPHRGDETDVAPLLHDVAGHRRRLLGDRPVGRRPRPEPRSSRRASTGGRRPRSEGRTRPSPPAASPGSGPRARARRPRRRSPPSGPPPRWRVRADSSTSAAQPVGNLRGHVGGHRPGPGPQGGAQRRPVIPGGRGPVRVLLVREVGNRGRTHLPWLSAPGAANLTGGSPPPAAGPHRPARDRDRRWSPGPPPRPGGRPVRAGSPETAVLGWSHRRPREGHEGSGVLRDGRSGRVPLRGRARPDARARARCSSGWRRSASRGATP